MTGIEGDTNLALGFEATDARPVAGTRIDDDEWALAGIDCDACGRHDAYQSIVHGPRQQAAVHDELMAELQHMRGGLCRMLLISLAALLQHVQKKHPALKRINPVGARIVAKIARP